LLKTQKSPFDGKVPTLGRFDRIDAASIAVQEDAGPVRGIND
jgi:hypothetical protein